MMTDISLRTKILLFVLGLIVASSVSTIFAVILATNHNVESQAKDKLEIGRNVFEQLMDMRATQLFESAQVLTSDFGFKAAVLGGDQSTIESVLDNHGARIGADLMMLASLDGELIASTGNKRVSEFPFRSLLAVAEVEGGLTTIVVIMGTPYQILMLPIKAPITSAWTLVGFEIDQSLANQLKELSDLEVTFSGLDDEQRYFEITTLSNSGDQANLIIEKKDNWQRSLRNGEEYLALITTLVEEKDYKVDAVLSASLGKALAKYSPLKIQMLLIAGIALLVSTVIGFVLSKNITRPVSNLVRAAERISDGDYSVDILDDRFRQNEIAKLATSLDKMQNGIAEREAKILHQVNHDNLTGLANRVSVQQSIDALIEQQSPKVCFGLMHVNVRRFKEVNDTFGYQIGDKLLVAIAKKLQALLAAPDTPSRLGADEFLLILCGQEGAEIVRKAEKLMSGIVGNYQIGELSIPVVVSYGLSIYPDHGERTNQMLRRADIALHEAQADKLKYKIYQPGADEKHLKQIRLVNDLKKAMADDELVMFYQPKLDVKLNRVTQVESLIRWIHPELGFIPPNEFIGLAEQSGLMPSLTRWVISDVLREAARWREMDVDLKMAVNLSAYDLVNDDLPVFIEQTLSTHGLDANAVLFEVTESAMMEDPEQALKVLNALKDKGIKLAVDDYGTGYSSLSQLKDMPVDELKIDMSFVLKLDESRFDQAIVQSTIEMGHKLGLSIVAEGVENYASWQLLEAWGCDKLQGYYIAKPQKADDFLEWFKCYEAPQGQEAEA